MAELTRIALFTWAGESRYGAALRLWARSREGVMRFGDTPSPRDGDMHYLRFAPMHAEQPFDVILCDIADTPSHAASFPLVLKHPCVLFLGDVRLTTYARRVNADAADPWGMRWMLRQTAPRTADAIARLESAGIQAGKALEALPLAQALATRSAAVVVPEYMWATELSHLPDMPPVSVMDPTNETVFAAAFDRMLPVWVVQAESARHQLAPLAHGNRDLRAIEHARAVSRFHPEDVALAAPFLNVLDELFG